MPKLASLCITGKLDFMGANQPLFDFVKGQLGELVINVIAPLYTAFRIKIQCSLIIQPQLFYLENIIALRRF